MRGEGRLSKDDLSADQRAALAQLAKSALIESAATEVVSIGRALFKDGAPSDPESQRRYRFYKALEAALALPAGPNISKLWTWRDVFDQEPALDWHVASQSARVLANVARTSRP